MDHKMTRRDALSFIRKAGLAAAAVAVPWELLEKIGASGDWMRSAEAGTLPSNYRVAPGQLLADTSPGIASLATNGVQSGDATWSLTEVTDPSLIRPKSPAPTKIFRLAVTNPGTVNALYQMTWSINLAPRNIGQVLMITRGENLGGSFPDCSGLLSDDANFTNFYIWSRTFNSTNGYEGIWRYHFVNRASFTVGGGAPNPDATFTRFRIRMNATPGTTPVYYICPTWINAASKPIVTVGFDDGYLTDFTAAYNYMQPRRIPGYSSVTSGILSGRNTVENMQVMQNNGWSIHNHGLTHANFTTLTESQMVQEVEACRGFLLSNGLTSGDLAFVYPQHGRNALSDSVVGRYYRYAAGLQVGEQVVWDGIPEPYRLGRLPMDNPATASTIIASINAAINNNQSINLYGHNVIPSAPVGQTDVTIFQPVVDHIMRLRDANVIHVRNLQDMLRGLSAARFRREAS